MEAKIKQESQLVQKIITYPSDITNIVVHGIAVSHLTLNSCASDTEYYPNALIGLFLIWFDYASGLHFKET